MPDIFDHRESFEDDPLKKNDKQPPHEYRPVKYSQPVDDDQVPELNMEAWGIDSVSVLT